MDFQSLAEWPGVDQRQAQLRAKGVASVGAQSGHRGSLWATLGHLQATLHRYAAEVAPVDVSPESLAGSLEQQATYLF